MTAELSFNSLQTGKAFRTDEMPEIKNVGDNKFQFPSNGKGFPNSC